MGAPECCFLPSRHDGLEGCIGCGHCDVWPQLDPRQVGGGGTVGKRPHETSRQVNIADAVDNPNGSRANGFRTRQ